MIPILANMINLKVIGDKIVSLIRKDASSGLMQNGSDTYKSEQYKRDKLNWAYRSIGQISNFVSSVNMELTGKLFSTLRAGTISPLKVEITFDKSQEHKLDTNAGLGRRLLMLSASNSEIIQKDIKDIIGKKLEESIRNTNINIKAEVGRA